MSCRDEPLQILRGHKDGLYTASFDPDGERVVTSSQDGTAKVWDVDSGRMISDLVGSRGPVIAASFSRRWAERRHGESRPDRPHLGRPFRAARQRASGAQG